MRSRVSTTMEKPCSARAIASGPPSGRLKTVTSTSSARLRPVGHLEGHVLIVVEDGAAKFMAAAGTGSIRRRPKAGRHKRETGRARNGPRRPQTDVPSGSRSARLRASGRRRNEAGSCSRRGVMLGVPFGAGAAHVVQFRPVGVGHEGLQHSDQLGQLRSDQEPHAGWQSNSKNFV